MSQKIRVNPQYSYKNSIQYSKHTEGVEENIWTKEG
jgi:hypothetical protein